ncbi:MAG: hypothetical protein JKY18_11535 [Flavobacteriales bacterium]|nr:hypothetical protein [Flavobacteriales bacterium]
MKKSTGLKIIVAATAGLILLVFSLDVEAQCAMCKASIESSVKDGEASPGAGINQGILYIMGIPYLLLSLVGFAIYRHNKQLKKQAG